MDRDIMTQAIASAMNERLDGAPGTIKLAEWLEANSARLDAVTYVLDGLLAEYEAGYV